MVKPFNTHPVLQAFSEGLNFVVMAGLTLASAAVLAIPAGPRAPSAEPILLPTVVVTAKSSSASTVPRLPTVIVTAKRSAG
jgi:hypothetical protein